MKIIHRRFLAPLFAPLLTTLLLSMSGLVNAAIDVPSGKYVLENTHGYISFSYSHLGFSTPHVGFNTFDVNLDFDAEAPEKSTISVSIDANSVDSRVEEFDGHLVGDRFFDTANHPTITFVATGIELGEADKATITGDLTIKGQTHPVTLNATLNKAGTHPMLKKPVMGFNAETTVKRSLWGLGYAAPMVSDEVNLFITVELQKADG
ncbi:MAG: polyisoprenoid-binding protein YceI [Limisphaerales bacterium]|jgi:polyisoprenoid-binding protein YceI